MELEQAACGTGNPLADKIRAIMYLEAEKPIDSIDSYLISECADFLAELEGMKRLSQSEIDSRVSAILSASHKKAIKRRSLRAMLIAACLIMALLIANIIAVSLGGTEYALFKYFSEYEPKMADGERLDIDNMTIIKQGNTVSYFSIDDFFTNEDYDALYPAVLPDGAKLIGIYISPSYSNADYVEILYHADDNVTTVTANTDPELINSIKSASHNMTVEEIGGRTCYTMKTPGVFQSTFYYNGFTYTVNTSSREKLVETINGMKEYGG